MQVMIYERNVTPSHPSFLPYSKQMCLARPHHRCLFNFETRSMRLWLIDAVSYSSHSLIWCIPANIAGIESTIDSSKHVEKSNTSCQSYSVPVAGSTSLVKKPRPALHTNPSKIQTYKAECCEVQQPDANGSGQPTANKRGATTEAPLITQAKH